MTLFLLGCVDPGGHAGGNGHDAGHDDPTHDDSGHDSASAPVELPFPEDRASAGGLLAGTLVAQSLGERLGYDGASPGPTLRLQVGDAVALTLQNDLTDTTTVHWHGLSVPNDMDGVAFVTDPVEPGATFDYAFTVDRPGTFWYHPHVDVSRQVDMGLYGAIVVAHPDDPVPDRDLVLVFDAEEEYEPEEETIAADHDGELHGGVDPSASNWLVNGVAQPTLALSPGERVLVRVVNASNAGYLSLTWPGARVVGGDQGRLSAPAEATEVLVAPGQRVELEVLDGQGNVEVTTGMWTPAGGAAYGDPQPVLFVTGSDTAGTPLDYVFDGASPSGDPSYADLVYTFQGGSDDEPWLIDGESWPDVTPRVVTAGAEVIVEARNLSATSHPFHLHGHRLELLSVNGVPPTVARWVDTVDVPIRATVRMKLLADNPGSWALHCHLLGHEDHGMMTILEVQ